MNRYAGLHCNGAETRTKSLVITKSLNPSLTICDELAAWSAEQGTKQYEVLNTALGSRKQSMILAISTAGYVNGGPYDSLMQRSTQLLLGNSKEKRLLPIIYQIDDVEKWNDINELKKANPNMGVTKPASHFIELAAAAEIIPSSRSEFIVKFANIKQQSASAWLSAKMINNAYQQVYSLSDFAHSYCVIGLDLSQTTDLTSISVIIEKEEKLNVFSHFWLPSAKLEEAKTRDSTPYDLYIQQGYMSLSGDGYVDYHDIENYILTLIRDYEILPLVVGYDRYSAIYLIQDLQKDGLKVDDVYQGNNLSPVIEEMEGLMLSQKINIADNNPIMKAHMANSALEKSEITKKKRLIKIINQSSSIHIDGVASLLDGLCVRQKWYDTLGPQLKNTD